MSGTTEAGVAWPPHARSTPELDRLQAQFSALMTYRTATALLGIPPASIALLR